MQLNVCNWELKTVNLIASRSLVKFLFFYLNFWKFIIKEVKLNNWYQLRLFFNKDGIKLILLYFENILQRKPILNKN